MLPTASLSLCSFWKTTGFRDLGIFFLESLGCPLIVLSDIQVV